MKKVVSVVLPLIFVAGAWLAGYFVDLENKKHLMDGVFSQYKPVETFSNGIRKVADNESGEVFYISIGKGNGYAGPLYAAVLADDKGIVKDVVIVKHGETPGFIGKVFKEGYPQLFRNKKYSDKLKPGEDVDGVSGATLSLTAMCQSVSEASAAIAHHNGAEPVLPEKIPFKPGIPEIAVLLLFFLSFYSKSEALKKLRYLPQVIMIICVVVIGFMYNALFSLTGFVSLLSGYVPAWQTHLYWFLMAGAVIIPPLLTKRNVYCTGLCPFGGVQDGLALAGGKNVKVPAVLEKIFRWLKNLLTTGIIIIALVYRNPGAAGYEISGTMFSLNGTTIQIALLILFLSASLFVKRPWCRFLCPVGVVTAYLIKIPGLLKKR